MIRIWLCPMVTDGEGTVKTKASLIFEGYPGSSSSAVDIPGLNRAIVYTVSSATAQDALRADADCRYITPYGIETRADLLAWLNTPIRLLSTAWANIVVEALEHHGFDASPFMAGSVRDLIDGLGEHHFRAQNPGVTYNGWAVLNG